MDDDFDPQARPPRRKHKKPYALLVRFRHWRRDEWIDWFVWSRYRTREVRDEARRQLQRKSFDRFGWETKVPDDEEA